MLNVSPDHLDRHGTIEHYAFLKSRVPGRARVAVIGVDDGYGKDMAANLSAMGREVVAVSTRGLVPHGYVAGESHLYRVNGKEAQEVADLSGIGSLRGMHNAQNAMAAFAASSSSRAHSR